MPMLKRLLIAALTLTSVTTHALVAPSDTTLQQRMDSLSRIEVSTEVIKHNILDGEFDHVFNLYNGLDSEQISLIISRPLWIPPVCPNRLMRRRRVL